jgi:hypothetical protein
VEDPSRRLGTHGGGLSVRDGACVHGSRSEMPPDYRTAGRPKPAKAGFVAIGAVSTAGVGDAAPLLG